MDAELQKNMQFLMDSETKNKLPELIPAEQKRMSDAYDELFFGLAGQNWGRDGKTLGAAWYAALEQIGGMLGAKNKNNPAVMHLNQIFAAQRIRWSQAAMTSSLKDKKMEMTPEGKQKWMSNCAKQIGNAMGVINAFIMKYRQYDDTPQQPATVKPDMKKIINFLAAKQNINTL